MAILLFSGRLSPEFCRQNPNLIFVFGDNLKRVGKGGQAVIRDEPNALGVATKRSPGMADEDFFEDGNIGDTISLINDLGNVSQLIKEGKQVVLPVLSNHDSSLGCGLANLPEKAPALYSLIKSWQARELKNASV